MLQHRLRKLYEFQSLTGRLQTCERFQLNTQLFHRFNPSQVGYKPIADIAAIGAPDGFQSLTGRLQTCRTTLSLAA